MSLFDWAAFRKTKAAVKWHTLLDLRGAIPAFIHISDGKMHEVNVLDILMLGLALGAYHIVDRCYLDFARLFNLHQSDAFFVTRNISNMNARRVYLSKVDRSTSMAMQGPRPLKHPPHRRLQML
ncbi:hypothetical protein B9Z51_16155 [Limnohabitans sp. T6-5]|nr:hypothetical protein B9Z51_16155 [Limnohabitans sp. T6-5]